MSRDSRFFSIHKNRLIVAANGGKLLSGVSKKLNYLIVGENAGPSKVDKAQQLGVPMIGEDEFMAMLGV